MSDRAVRAAVLLPAALLLLATPCHAGDTQTELWPEAHAFLKLDARFRVFLLAKLVYSPASWTVDGASSYQEIETGPHLDITLRPIRHHGLKKPVWERERWLWARLGYTYISTFGDVADASRENRGVVELTGRARLPEALWAVSRGRMELRDKDGAFSTRYRYRLTLERETTLFGAVTMPYVNGEVFYDTSHHAWSRQRYEPRHLNAVGLILQYQR